MKTAFPCNCDVKQITATKRRNVMMKYRMYSTANQRTFGTLSPDGGANEPEVDSALSLPLEEREAKKLLILLWVPVM